jgi:hypothetical protein
MRTIIFLISVSVSLVAFGQQNSKTKPFKEWLPLCYLDSVNIEFTQAHFDMYKLADIHIEGNYTDSARQIHGKIFMTSKVPKDYHFLTISDISRIHKIDTLSPSIFMLDNEFLKDISRFTIDSSYILRVEIIRGSEFDYLKNNIPNLTILKIIQRTEENLARQNRIMIK